MATDSQQHWNAEEYARHARFIADLARPLIGMLDPKPSETILDLGCGDGVLAAEIQRLGVRVIGVDGAPAMVDAACKLGMDACLMDDHLRPPKSGRIKRPKHSFFVEALPKNHDGRAFKTILRRQARTTKGRNA